MTTIGVGTDLAAIRPKWEAVVKDVLARATLTIPTDPYAMTGGRKGSHTESLGHMLSEMQIVARSHPGAEW
jgi:ring-1,2-phenylacetyl-CoA epoxidase subunit PaaC